MITACGILPYYVVDGGLYFLLGKERTSGKYCDFGGRKEIGEDDKTTAKREFMEETMNIFDGTGGVISFPPILNPPYKCFLIKFDNMYLERINTYNNMAKIIDLYGGWKESNGLMEKTKLKWFSVSSIRENKGKMRESFLRTLRKI